MANKIDILAFAAHPDDVELACSGTLMKHKAQGKTIGVIDLTLGQLGTRGNEQTRLEEAAKASQIMQLDVRENLEMQDGFFTDDKENRLKVMEAIRKYKPNLVLCNAIADRHPDHARAAKLVKDSCFYAGLKKIETNSSAHRPNMVLSYIQDYYIKPDIIVDISEYFEKKMESILAYSTQFYDPKNKEKNTPISSKEFIDFLEGRAREFGRTIGVEFGEGFNSYKTLGIDDLLSVR